MGSKLIPLVPDSQLLHRRLRRGRGGGVAFFCCLGSFARAEFNTGVVRVFQSQPFLLPIIVRRLLLLLI
jgi:hypothetical protein